jgi:hypothetical protein
MTNDRRLSRLQSPNLKLQGKTAVPESTLPTQSGPKRDVCPIPFPPAHFALYNSLTAFLFPSPRAINERSSSTARAWATSSLVGVLEQMVFRILHGQHAVSVCSAAAAHRVKSVSEAKHCHLPKSHLFFTPLPRACSQPALCRTARRVRASIVCMSELGYVFHIVSHASGTVA